MDDVFERLEVLDSHFHSPIFSKMQGGEKTEVTLSDMETLFGKPNQVVEEIEMNHAEVVHQYYYEDLTLNFHQHFSNIDEYVIENFTGVLYDSQILDQLFIDTITIDQSLANKEAEKFEFYLADDASPSIVNETPTRKIRQSGWHTWPFNQQYYFDDGQGEYAPEEYLSLQFKEDTDGATELHLMERRYRAAYSKKDTEEEVGEKKEALFTFIEFFEEKEKNHLAEKRFVKDFLQAFGDVARIIYNFREGELRISWIIKEDKGMKEMTAIVPVSDSNKMTNREDLANLEVLDFDPHILSRSNRTVNKDEFIGSK